MARRRSERTPDRKLSPRTPIRRAAALAAFVGVLAISAVTAVPGAASAAEDVDDVSPVVSDAGFTHPGVFNSLDSLKATRARVLVGEAPWADNFAQLASSPYVDREAPDFKTFGAAGATDPKSVACDRDERKGCVTVCGSFNKNPDVGCADQQADSRAVYGQALMYWYSGDATYAQRAIEILNAYSKHFKGSRGSNGPLMTAWTAGLMVRGAELIRYTYQPESSEQKFDVDAFESLLREAFVPTLTSFDYGRFNGNWKLSAAEGLISVAVFLDDRRLYNQAVAMWRERPTPTSTCRRTVAFRRRPRTMPANISRPRHCGASGSTIRRRHARRVPQATQASGSRMGRRRNRAATSGTPRWGSGASSTRPRPRGFKAKTSTAKSKTGSRQACCTRFRSPRHTSRADGPPDSAQTPQS